MSDLASVSSARTNLGLGSLATLSSVSDAQITSLSYSKLTSIPSAFTPSAHNHVISDVTGLQTALDAKLSVAKLSLNCTAAQTIQYNSVPDNYTCQSIAIPSTQVSGLGSLATKSSVADSDISALSGSKLTGGIQVGTVSGTTCSSAGLTRYNSSNLEVCDGSNWKVVSSFSNASTPIMSDWQSFTPIIKGDTSAPSLGTGAVIQSGYWRRVGDKVEVTQTIVVGSSGSSSGSGSYYFPLPNSLQIDTGKIFYTALAAGQSPVLGEGHTADTGGSAFAFNQVIFDSGKVRVWDSTSSVYSSTTRAVVAGRRYTISYSAPVLGWSASTSQVAVYTPPVAAQIYGAAGTFSTGAVITGSVAYDTATALSSSRFTCPYTGIYRVHGTIRLSSSGTATAYIYKNAIQQSELVGLDNTLGKSFSGSVQCNVGDILDVRPNNTVSLSNAVINFEKVN